MQNITTDLVFVYIPLNLCPTSCNFKRPIGFERPYSRAQSENAPELSRRPTVVSPFPFLSAAPSTAVARDQPSPSGRQTGLSPWAASTTASPKLELIVGRHPRRPDGSRLLIWGNPSHNPAVIHLSSIHPYFLSASRQTRHTISISRFPPIKSFAVTYPTDAPLKSRISKDTPNMESGF